MHAPLCLITVWITNDLSTIPFHNLSIPLPYSINQHCHIYVYLYFALIKIQVAPLPQQLGLSVLTSLTNTWQPSTKSLPTAQCSSLIRQVDKFLGLGPALMTISAHHRSVAMVKEGMRHSPRPQSKMRQRGNSFNLF